VIEIERVRALRLAKEQAEEALEAAERSSIVLRKHELLNASEQSAILSEQSVKQAEAKLLETVGMIQTESQKLLDAERVHTLRQNKARMQARQAQLRQEWAEKSGRQLTEVISAQGELQGQMLKLQQAALRSELDRDMAYATGTATTSSQFEEARVSSTAAMCLQPECTADIFVLHRWHSGRSRAWKTRCWCSSGSASRRSRSTCALKPSRVNRRSTRLPAPHREPNAQVSALFAACRRNVYVLYLLTPGV
jgi:hypothetical protein